MCPRELVAGIGSRRLVCRAPRCSHCSAPAYFFGLDMGHRDHTWLAGVVGLEPANPSASYASASWLQTLFGHSTFRFHAAGRTHIADVHQTLRGRGALVRLHRVMTAWAANHGRFLYTVLHRISPSSQQLRPIELVIASLSWRTGYEFLTLYPFLYIGIVGAAAGNQSGIITRPHKRVSSPRDTRVSVSWRISKF